MPIITTTDGTTVSELIDRVLREWLIPPDDQPLKFALSGDIDDTTTTLPYDAALLPAELEDLLGPGTLVEVGEEHILLGSVDTGTGEVTGCVRGANGTARATHESGDLVTLAPAYSRQAVFDALGDAVTSLHPQLLRVNSTQVTVEKWNEAPTGLIDPINFTFISDFGEPVEVSVQWSAVFPDATSGKAVVISAPKGTEGYLNYRGRFERPLAPSDTLADLGVNETWAQLLVVGAVHRVITSRDLAAATQEFLTRQLAQQGFPVPSATQLRDGIVNYYEYLMEKAKADQLAEHDISTIRTFPVGSPWR